MSTAPLIDKAMVIETAVNSGFAFIQLGDGLPQFSGISHDALLRFANALLSAERQACAELCTRLDGKVMRYFDVDHLTREAEYAEPKDCAAAILARNETPLTC